jgi:hypothetical protein
MSGFPPERSANVDGQLAVLATRLNGIDEATKVLSETLNRTPTILQTAVTSFGALVDEKFLQVRSQFEQAERVRLEQKQDSKTGLDAALSAQKEAAATQDINNQKAIDKSERATAEIIKNNQDANRQALETLTKGVDELKLEVSKIVSMKQGGGELRAWQISVAIVVLMVVSASVALFAALHK